MSDVAGWLASRTPPAPDSLPLPLGSAAGEPGIALTEAGMAALARALAGRGERGGAYDLLAADALLTYACEWAASAPDPEAELRRIVARIGRAGG